MCFCITTFFQERINLLIRSLVQNISLIAATKFIRLYIHVCISCKCNRPRVRLRAFKKQVEMLNWYQSGEKYKTKSVTIKQVISYDTIVYQIIVASKLMTAEHST